MRWKEIKTYAQIMSLSLRGPLKRQWMILRDLVTNDKLKNAITELSKNSLYKLETKSQSIRQWDFSQPTMSLYSFYNGEIRSTLSVVDLSNNRVS